MSISDEFLKNVDRKKWPIKNLKVPMESRKQGVSTDGKENEFPTRFARFLQSGVWPKKSAKPDCPCVAYYREEMRQFRDLMKK